MQNKKINLLIAAPHFLYPPKGGNDILIWERYSKLKEFRNCIFLGADEIIYIQNGVIDKTFKYNKNKFFVKIYKYLEISKVLIFGGNYLYYKYINKKFVNNFKNLINKYHPDNVILSHTYTLIALKKNKLLSKKTNYICETHNNDWEWFNNIKKEKGNILLNFTSLQNYFYRIFLNKVCDNSIKWLNENLQSIPKNVNFSFISELDKSKLSEKLLLNNNFVLLPQIPNYCIKEKKYEGNLNYSGNNLNLLFVGSLQIIQNIESLKYFSKIFFPLIKEKYPNICVDIVGRYPTIFIKHLCKLNNWNIFVDLANNDLREKFIKTDFLILPFISSNGFKLKFIESLAHGTPILGTRSVAYLSGDEKIPLSLFSDSPLEWINHILNVKNLNNYTIYKERNKIINFSKRWHPEVINKKIIKYMK